MEPDIYALSKAGFSKERIEEITRCDDKEIQIRMLRKCRYQLLDEIHGKQQSLDEIDYIICKMKEQKQKRMEAFYEKNYICVVGTTEYIAEMNDLDARPAVIASVENMEQYTQIAVKSVYSVSR